MTACKDQRDNFGLEDRLQDRSIIALDDPCEGDGELPVVQLAETHVHGVLQASAEQEKGGSVV
jgi:hypothetical protein